MYKKMVIMVVCVTLLSVVGCKKEKDASCGTCGDDKAVAAEKACPADCTKPCCKKAEDAKACPADCTKPCCAEK